MLLLASNSATRAKILRDRGIEFIQKGCDFDEEGIKESNPKSFVYQATMGKYQTALKEFGLEIPLLVADTVVTAHSLILRKAKNKKEAKEILSLQSNSVTSIITCMIYKSRELELIDISATHYKFREFDKEGLEVYLDSGDWKGKAGACMVEGFCKEYIESVKGYESTAMGLCVEKLIPFLEE
jgi:septum formation protein